jgi:hypothetical protein
MRFMDSRTLFFSHCWKEAIGSSQSIHRFRSHSKEELTCFERILSRRANRHILIDNPSGPDLFSGSLVCSLPFRAGR